MSVEIDVLGSLRLRRDGVDLRPGGLRERTVLAVLASAAGRQVSDDRLVDEVWGDDPPATAIGSLQVAISRLRKVMGEGADLRREATGYVLDGVSLDATEFSEAARTLDAPAPDVLRRTEEALALWRGAPYTGLVGSPILQAEQTRLEEDRLRLIEARAQALLDVGRADDARALVTDEARAQPFRERLWSLLALALYRCDRQSEALEVLRELRHHLVEELGVDPSPSVRRLEAQVLDHAEALSGPAAPGDATRSHISGVVGRREALAAIDQSLTELTEQQRGGVVLITGEAGIGKSMLAAELAYRATERGVQVLQGRCHEADLAPAYWPWLPVVRALTGGHQDLPPELSALLGEARRELGHDGDGVGAATASTLRTFAAVAELLASVGRPLVVVLEDVHWADDTSLRLLSHVAAELRDRPVLFVATVRTVDPRSHTALARTLADLSRLQVRRVPVPPLDDDGVAALLEGVLDDPGSDLVGVLRRRSDGNPFFALEMARLLCAEGPPSVAAAEGLDVPAGIADVLRLRVLMLDAKAQRALAAAAVIGRDFDVQLLQTACHVGLDDLDGAARAGLVEESGEPGGFRFVHALTRETVYADLSTGERARLHAAVGRTLVSRLAQDPDLLAPVAEHHARAAAFLPDLADEAIDYGSRAAAAAEARNAFAEALALWSRTEELDRRTPHPDPERRHRLLVALALAKQRLGDIHGMTATLGEAIRFARQRGDRLRMAEAAMSFRSSWVWHWREMGDDDPWAIGVLEECLAHLTDVRLQARLWSNLALEHYVAWRDDEADRCGVRSIELARESGDPEVLRDCLASREVALWAPGRAPEREAYARESLTLDLPSEYELAAYFQLGTSLHNQGRYDEADEIMARAFAVSDRLGYTGCDVPLGWWRWLRALESDDPQAPVVAAEILSLHRRTTVVGLQELTVLTALARRPPGGPVPGDVVDVATGHPNAAFRSGVAHALVTSGETEAAVRVLDWKAGRGADYASLYGGCLAVATLAAARHPDLPAALGEILPHRVFVATYGSVMSLGAVSYWTGLGLAALGRVDEARTDLLDAREKNAKRGSNRWVRAADQAILDLVGGKDGGKAGESRR
jgi:DNA-binding SARP family transcriptional activator